MGQLRFAYIEPRPAAEYPPQMPPVYDPPPPDPPAVPPEPKVLTVPGDTD